MSSGMSQLSKIWIKINCYSINLVVLNVADQTRIEIALKISAPKAIRPTLRGADYTKPLLSTKKRTPCTLKIIILVLPINPVSLFLIVISNLNRPMILLIHTTVPILYRGIKTSAFQTPF